MKIYNSQGSVAMHVRCGGIFVTTLRQIFRGTRQSKMLKIGHVLAKLMTKVWYHVLWLRVQTYLLAYISL